MAKKNRGLSGMDAVAGKEETKPEVDVNNDTNVGTDVDTNGNNGSIDDIIGKVIGKEKPESKRQVAIYLSQDVAKAFDKYARKYGKGAKSELSEELLRSALSKMEYL